MCHIRTKRRAAFGNFSELESILLGLDLTEYVPLFEEHKVGLDAFLCLTEEDLEKMGIDKVRK
jgi:hypothetical protein